MAVPFTAIVVLNLFPVLWTNIVNWVPVGCAGTVDDVNANHTASDAAREIISGTGVHLDYKETPMGKLTVLT